jgi:LDH2 family malate/lactate/ureidoglycolate dehydrogenase
LRRWPSARWGRSARAVIVTAARGSTATIVPAAALHETIRACFNALGVAEHDSRAVADALTYANLRGIDSHGLARVPVYMRRVKDGLAGGSERVSEVARHGALCRLDAGHALGPAAAVKAIDLAIEMAGSHGVGFVALGNSTNFGAAGFYALRAAQRRLVGIVATNAPKLMAPYGSREAFLGSNALAIATPMDDRDEFVLDMSSTMVARGKIRRAGALGTSIESGLALDKDGNPTTDPDQALAGVLLPLGGPKGTGLAFAITILAGLLAGADFDDEVASIYRDSTRAQNLGQLFVVIDPWRIADAKQVPLRLSRLADRLHDLSVQPGFDGVHYAGEGAAARARERLGTGIPIETVEIEAIMRACSDCGLPELGRDVGGLISRGPTEPGGAGHRPA